MEVTIKKVSHTDDLERFVLIDTATRKVLTVHDTSERALRHFFEKRGVVIATIDACLERARQRYAEATQAQASVDQAADTSEDDLLAGLDFEDDLS